MNKISTSGHPGNSPASLSVFFFLALVTVAIVLLPRLMSSVVRPFRDLFLEQKVPSGREKKEEKVRKVEVKEGDSIKEESRTRSLARSN